MPSPDSDGRGLRLQRPLNRGSAPGNAAAQIMASGVLRRGRGDRASMACRSEESSSTALAARFSYRCCSVPALGMASTPGRLLTGIPSCSALRYSHLRRSGELITVAGRCKAATSTAACPAHKLKIGRAHV